MRTIIFILLLSSVIYSQGTTFRQMNSSSIAAIPPVLVSPANGATNLSITPTFQWTGDAGNYRIQVSPDAGFSSLAINMAVGDTTQWTSTINLAYNTVYYWRVISQGLSSWSNTRRFVTTFDQLQLLSPVNLAEGVSAFPTFYWSDIAPKYHLQISHGADFPDTVLFVQNIFQPFYQVIDSLASPGVYYWRVKALSQHDSTLYTVPFSFTTIAPLPDIPVLATPVDDSIGVGRLPLLVWNTADNAVTYQTQLSRVSTFAFTDLDSAEIADTSLQTADSLLGNTIYYWRVRSVSAIGISAWSDTSSFLTIPDTLQAPLLVAPADSSTGVTLNPLYDWYTVPYATRYRLQVSTATNFLSTVLDTTIAVIPLLQGGFDLEYNTKYYFRVQAQNDYDSSLYSDVWEFTTKQDLPQVLSFLISSDNKKLLGNDPKYLQATAGNPISSGDFYPAQNTDDVWWNTGGGYSDNTVLYAFREATGTLYESGIRFNNLDISQGATIDTAYVEFTCDANTGSDALVTRIKGEANATPAAFTNYSNATGRIRTTAFVDWNISGGWVVNQKYSTAEIKTIIQEIVNLAGWTANSELVLFFATTTGTANIRDAECYNDGQGNYAKLHIAWH